MKNLKNGGTATTFAGKTEEQSNYKISQMEQALVQMNEAIDIRFVTMKGDIELGIDTRISELQNIGGQQKSSITVSGSGI